MTGEPQRQGSSEVHDHAEGVCILTFSLFSSPYVSFLKTQFLSSVTKLDFDFNWNIFGHVVSSPRGWLSWWRAVTEVTAGFISRDQSELPSFQLELNPNRWGWGGQGWTAAGPQECPSAHGTKKSCEVWKKTYEIRIIIISYSNNILKQTWNKFENK